MKTLEDLESLKKLDSSAHPEAPDVFDRGEAEATFLMLADHLRSLFPSVSAESGAAIQDASFHGQIVLRRGDSYVSIRASNFGRLVTMVDEDSVLRDVEVSFVRAAFGRFRYVYVPHALLAAKYDGACRGVSGFRDYFGRFFDYI
jgi:hypothetical protein